MDPKEILVEISSLSDADLLRLYLAARRYALTLGRVITPDDLIQEAYKRVLDGTRVRPFGLPLVPFLLGIMRSIASSWATRLRHESVDDLEPLDPGRTPEDQLQLKEEVQKLLSLFDSDPLGKEIIECKLADMTPMEIREKLHLSDNEYRACSKRIRRRTLAYAHRTGKWQGTT